MIIYSFNKETGEFIDYKKEAYNRQRNHFLPIIQQLAKEGKWQEFCDRVIAVYEVMPDAFNLYYEDIPKELRRDFVLTCYSDHGDSIPACRKAVRGLERNGINELPTEYANQDYITVYRAGEEPIEKANYRLSWTLSEDVARFFYDTYKHRHANAIYKAKIRPCDVIAYMNDRDEQEVLQYRKVYDIEVVERGAYE